MLASLEEASFVLTDAIAPGSAKSASFRSLFYFRLQTSFFVKLTHNAVLERICHVLSIFSYKTRAFVLMSISG